MKGELKRILCIDDDQDILSIVEICLKSMGGYEVFACTTGKEALLRAQEIKPDLILLDVMMPGMDGLTVAREIRKNRFFEETPIIFMTARVQPHEVDNYNKEGAIGVIAKPFDPMKLVEQIRVIWSKRHV